MTVNVAVIYYSSTGTVYTLAEAVAEGATSAGAEVRLHRAAELAPAEAIAQNPQWRRHLDATSAVPVAQLDDLAWADAYAFGTPTRFGTPAAQLKQFIDQAGGLYTGPAWLVLALACACQFMVILDVSIVNVALPSVQRDLGFTDTALVWVVNGYVLAFAGFMLLGGRAADLLGHRRVLVSGLALFSLASLIAGLATSAELLVVARTAEGLGGAMLAPATLAVINTCFSEGAQRARAFGAWSASGGVGGMVGAVVGGVLTTGLSWRWVFLINVPIGAVLIAVAMTSLTTRPGRREPMDLAGALTGTAGLAALIYGVMQTSSHALESARVLLPVAAGVLLLVIFLVVEKRFAAAPMMPLRLFSNRSVAVSNAMLFLFGGIAIAMWFFTSLLMQNVLGYSALEAGLGQTPAAVIFVVVARFAAGWLPKTGVRLLVLAACACFVTGFGWLSRSGVGSHYATSVLGPTLLVAIGIGLVFPTLMARQPPTFRCTTPASSAAWPTRPARSAVQWHWRYTQPRPPPAPPRTTAEVPSRPWPPAIRWSSASR